jgi:monofunctional glycosyltransferase
MTGQDNIDESRQEAGEIKDANTLLPAEKGADENEKSRRSVLRRIFKITKYAAVIFFGFSFFIVVLYSFVPPPVTPLMVIRAMQKAGEQGNRIEKDWVPIEQISQNLIDAVVASEDNNFLSHFGIDRKAISDAVEYNKKNRRTRGASTITQQVAKNVFLWPSRTYLRKGFELYFTFLIEAVWSKKRIMEVYLNVIETGNGVYGAEAAAQKYFHKKAARLTRGEAALIAVSLPNPRQRNPSRPTSYMLSRQSTILNLMDKIGNIKFN